MKTSGTPQPGNSPVLLGDRRDFLKKTALVGSALAVGAPTLLESPPAFAARLREQGRGQVVGVEHPGAMLLPSKENAAIVERMTGEAIKRLTGKRTLVKAWRELISPSDVVGIKINCLGAPGISTSPAMVRAITKGLAAIGVPNERIIVYDMYEGHITRRGSGFTLNEDPSKGPLVRHLGDKGTRTDTGLLHYEKTAQRHKSGTSRFANLLKHCTAVINAPVIKDHSLAGVTAGMKNMTHGNIHNPDAYHKADCNPAIADIYDHPAIKDKVRVIVCDGLRVLYDGGPQGSARARVVHSRIYAGTDPVAMDSWAAKLIDDLRKENGKSPIAKRHPSGSYLATAEKLGLGVADLARVKMELTQLG